MADTGLLVTHSLFDRYCSDNTLYKSILLDKVDVNEGMLTENAVSWMLRANRHKLFFYSRPSITDEDGTVEKPLEVDFLIQSEVHPSPGPDKMQASSLNFD